MQSVEAILSQLANMKNLDAVRWAVVTLIREQLHNRRDALDGWETMHLANAINMLTMNVNALQQPTTAWLRLCLVDLQHALMPREERPSALPEHCVGDEQITHDHLTEALDAVIRQLDRRTSQSAKPNNVFRRYLDRISNVGNLDFGTQTLRR